MADLPDWHQDLSDDVLAEALHAYNPPVRYDPDDITTWNAAQLDELGVWAAACDGCEIDEIGEGQEISEHAVTEQGDHEQPGQST